MSSDGPMPLVPHDQLVAMRLMEFNEDIDLRIERLNRRIEVLNQQIAVNDAQLAALPNPWPDVYEGDDLFEENQRDDENILGGFEYEEYPDSDSDGDSDAETVVEAWEDPSKTPNRGYSVYYPRYLDEGLDVLEDM